MDYLDDQLFAEFTNLPSLHFVKRLRDTHTQALKLKQDFLKNEVSPTFHYEIDQEEINECIKQIQAFQERIPALTENEFVAQIYQELVDELFLRANILRAMSTGDDASVTRISKDLTGAPSESAKQLQAEFKDMLLHAHRFTTPPREVDATLFTSMTRMLLDAYGMNDWQVELHDGLSTHILHGDPNRPGKVHIPSNLRITAKRAARLLTHEIEVHVLRTENGRKSPLRILGKRLDRYITTEEGVAIYYQQQVASKPPKHAPGFWNAWTNALTLEGTFVDTYRTIRDAKLELNNAIGRKNSQKNAEEIAWKLCIRSYRGITNTGAGNVGYMRDHIYRTGLHQVKEFCTKHPEKASMLFYGNAGLHHLDTLEKLKLPDPETPKMLSTEIVNTVLKEEKA